MVPNSRGSFTTPSVVSFKVRGRGSSGSKKKKSTKRQQQQQQQQGQASSPTTASNRRNNSRTGRRRASARTPVGGGGEIDLDYDYTSKSPDVAPAAGKAEDSRSSSSSRRSAAKEQQGGGGGQGLARIYVGEAAVARIATHPRSTYSSVKRIVGRTKKQAKEAGVGLGALNVDQVRDSGMPGFVSDFFFFLFN